MQDCCGPLRLDGFCSGCVECNCAAGCDTRRVYCNYFRYGQCHQEIAQSGPIACRVVTCVPPYATDPSCSTASAVDNSTAEHASSSPCVTAPPPPLPPPEYFRRKGRNVIQVLLYNTLNVFYVTADGTLIQKVFAPGPNADANGWVTSRLTAAGRCKADSDVDAQDGHMSPSAGGPTTRVSSPRRPAAARSGRSGFRWLAPPSEHAASTRTTQWYGDPT